MGGWIASCASRLREGRIMSGNCCQQSMDIAGMLAEPIMLFAQNP